MKINQYCSVCKKHLDMEVIPTDDGGDDGVIWLRCPECQGFLPKFTGDGLAGQDRPVAATAEPTDSTESAQELVTGEPAATADSADPEATATPPEATEQAADNAADESATDEAASEPIAEYAAQLAAADPEQSRPYRPSATYEVGDLIHHLAYGDLGIVVAKEQLPGGRLAVKVFFEGAGVVHLIEQAADGH